MIIIYTGQLDYLSNVHMKDRFSPLNPVSNSVFN